MNEHNTGGLEHFNSLGQRFPNNPYLLLESAKVGTFASFSSVFYSVFCHVRLMGTPGLLVGPSSELPVSLYDMILVNYRKIAQQNVYVQAEMALMKNSEAAYSFEKVFTRLQNLFYSFLSHTHPHPNIYQFHYIESMLCGLNGYASSMSKKFSY